MLALTRTQRANANTLILEVPGYPPIKVRISRAKGAVSVGIEAPKEVKIVREEIQDKGKAA